MPRQHLLLGIGIAVLVLTLAVIGSVYEVPQAVLLPVVMALALGSSLLHFSRVRRTQLATISNPEIADRLKAACERIGRPDLQPVVVSGNGLPVLQVVGPLVQISPKTDQLLTDDELDALLLQSLSAQPSVLKQEQLRYYGPWLVLLAVTIIWSVIAWRPYFGLVLPVAAFWFNFDSRRRPGFKRSQEAAYRAFLARGGNGEHLLSALLKHFSALVQAGYKQTAIIVQLRGSIEILVQLAGLPSDRIDGLAAVVQAPPQLRVAWKPSRWLLWGPLMWVLLLVLSVAVTMALGNAN